MKKTINALPILLLISYISFIYYNQSASFSDIGIIFPLAALYGFVMWLNFKEGQLRKQPTNPEIEKLEIELMKANLEMENLKRHKEISAINGQIKHQEELSEKPYKF